MSDSIKEEPYADEARSDTRVPREARSAKIISANYHNRRDPNRWLVRDQHHSKASFKTCAAIIATNVAFGRSSEYEQGFGCGVVARAESVTVFENPRHFEAVGTGFERIVFYKGDWSDQFYPEASKGVKHCRIASVDELFLLPDGSMFASGISYGGAQERPFD